MKRAGYLSWFAINALCVFTMGCVEATGGRIPTTITSAPQQTIQQEQRTWYGEKARVAVMEFENKTGVDYQVSDSMKGTTVRDPVGSGMKEQMVTALMQAGQFIVLERQAIKDVVGEQDFGASGRVKHETAAAIGEIEGVEFLIYGAVTEYLPSQASVSAGAGVDPLLGALGAGPGSSLLSLFAQRAVAAASANQDHVAIDVRLVDAKTGRVVNATSVEATPEDFGGSLGGIFGSVLLGASTQVQTPLQKAVRACIIKAVNWTADKCLEHRQQTAQLAPSLESKQPVKKKSRKSTPTLNTPKQKTSSQQEDKKNEEWGQ